VREGNDAVVLQGVRKRYSRRGAWVLGGVDLTVRRGTGIVVVGSNGSGKSTLLRLVARLTLPTAGRIETDSQSVAYAPERLAGNIRMSARVYLAHMAALRHLEPGRAAPRVEELARRFALLPGLDEPVRNLSKGNNQKVALMQAFLAPVDLLLLDEPYSGLDTTARGAVSELVAAGIDAGSAVVLSSHAPVDVHRASRNLHLRHGRLEPEAGSAADRRVVIRLATDQPSARAADLRALPGVAAVRDLADGEVELGASPAESDDVLRAVLGLGWSVRSVRSVRSSYATDDERRL